MLVSEIGEFGLISLLSSEFGVVYPPSPGARPRSGLLVDLGDDALVTQRQDAAVIWTTDTMVAGVHFLPDKTDWSNTGWKALAVNVSDIAAMGGEPWVALVTLAVPQDMPVEQVQALYRGLHEAAQEYGVLLGGGDIVSSPVFSVTVALAGRADLPRLGQPRVMTRSAARAGDLVAVSGSLGDSAGGLELLRQGSSFSSAGEQALRAAHERPRPRLALGRRALLEGVRCAIDVSDGLVQDLGHIAKASNVGIRIEASRVPVSEQLEEAFPSRALGLALSGGEDYELVLVAGAPIIERLLEVSDTPLTVIGEAVRYDGPRVAVVDESGWEMPMPSGGWDHLARRWV